VPGFPGGLEIAQGLEKGRAKQVVVRGTSHDQGEGVSVIFGGEIIERNVCRSAREKSGLIRPARCPRLAIGRS
jgi:hypothetical protein